MRHSKLVRCLLLVWPLAVAAIWLPAAGAEPAAEHRYDNRVGGVELRLVLTGDPGPANLGALPEAGSRLTALLRQAVEDMGRAPEDISGELVLAYDFAPPDAAATDNGAVRVEPSFNILSIEAASIMASDMMRALDDVVLGDGAGDLPSWLSEGAPVYYGMLLPYQEALISADEFWDRLSLTYAAYVDGADAASHGAIALAAIEQRLRELSDDRISLADMWKGLGEREGALDATAVRATLESLTGTSWQETLANWTESGDVINASTFSTLKSAPEAPAGTAGKVEDSGAPRGYAWLFIALGALLILAIPILLEPYTVKPRK
ncbi:MAG: hypothetical protein ACYC55_06635 [Candidatus Geothermincolia bacterium]